MAANQEMSILLRGNTFLHRLLIPHLKYTQFFLPKLSAEEINSINHFESTNQANLSIYIISRDSQTQVSYQLSLYHKRDSRPLQNPHAIRRFTRLLARDWGAFCRARGLVEGDTVIFSWAQENPRVLLLRVAYGARFSTPPKRARTEVGHPQRGRRILGLPPVDDKGGAIPPALALVHLKSSSPFPMARSLYVVELDPKVNAIGLYFVFVCNVADVCICYDKWCHSLCYGYVNFFSPLEAAKAMSLLSHTNLKGKPMRIMWCERNAITRKTGKANLFVKNLDCSVDSARLDSIFSKFGTVLSCKVAEDENGKSEVFGFVQFDQEQSAMKALNSLHNTLLERKKLYVSNFMKSSQRNQTFTIMYVKSLQKDVSEDDFKEFYKFGKINGAAIMRDGLGISKGFGFVSFESPEDAKKVMESLNGTPALGCESLFVWRAPKKVERERMMKERLANRKASVYVNCLVPNVNEGMLKSHLSVFGKVVQANVMRYPNIIDALVTFSSLSEAKIAASSLFGLSLIHRPLYGAKVQCMEGERNYPISVKHPFPPDSAAGNIVHLSSQIKGDKGLNFLTANGSANANALYENHKHLP